ncbi:hypothetical protein [Saccharothrix longispora]|uniref:hypothetical protein n=1 Tax=Saccharothrix longispora TaxID=33920 RepID=UPI0028FD4F8A|nr:hypothetical protein [Saccharothrix longispora]MDU0292299.1 hypothetical protein [Saccharothrix longispora]
MSAAPLAGFIEGDALPADRDALVGVLADALGPDALEPGPLEPGAAGVPARSCCWARPRAACWRTRWRRSWSPAARRPPGSCSPTPT